MASSAVGFTFKLTMRAEHRSHRFTVGPRPAELNTAPFWRRVELASPPSYVRISDWQVRIHAAIAAILLPCATRRWDESLCMWWSNFPMRIWVKIEHSETQLQFRTSADSDEQLSCGSNSLAKVNGTRMSLDWDGRLFARGDQEKVQYGPVWYWFISQVDWFETQSIHCWRSIFNLLVLS